MPATPDGPALIGIDIGTSAIKAVMIGPEGQILDRFAAAVPSFEKTRVTA